MLSTPTLHYSLGMNRCLKVDVNQLVVSLAYSGNAVYFNSLSAGLTFSILIVAHFIAKGSYCCTQNTMIKVVLLYRKLKLMHRKNKL